MIDSTESHPGRHVRSHVIPTGMSVTKAAETIGIGRVALSNFLNGKAALSPKMAAKLQQAFGADADDLIARQAAHEAGRRASEQEVSVTTRTFVPPFLIATASDIQDWADTSEARDLLAVLIRTLVHSTCRGLQTVDFPGRDDSQRPGWDGRVDTTEGNPWVPAGASMWEFGTNKNVAKKANGDYGKRTSATAERERRDAAFVFVTPRRWLGKEAWLRDRNAEGKWRTVRALDASDLEQWFEQSIPGQVWFQDRRGRNTRGVKSLDRCWVEWCADCRPHFTEEVFAEAAASFRDEVLRHLQDEPGTLLRIVADSRLEGLAFLSVVVNQVDKVWRGFRDRIAVFTEEGPLSELAVGVPGFIPVVTSAETERELAQSGIPITGFVVEHRTPAEQGSVVTLDPLSEQAFTAALSSLGLDTERIQRLDQESGRSPTVLRRRLAQSEAIKSPPWSVDEDLARSLVPMALAGAWVSDRDADLYLMSELAGQKDYSKVETQFTTLLNLEDAPVWSIGRFHGVVSKVDALFGVYRWMTEDNIDRFLEVAEIVLSERDPALDLPEDERWAAPVHEKVREISAPLRKGVAESLVLLSIHGHRLFGRRLGREPRHKVADLVRGLLEPLTADGLLSQSSNLPLYAEAAPEVFLEVFERDLRKQEPVVKALMRPTHDTLFQRSDRVDLLWALELLAWRPEWLARVVELLGDLTALEPDDNLANTPSESLHAIFRAWMPQTGAPVEQRIAALDALRRRHPAIAWRLASSQFEPGSRIGHYSHKPRWRDYALGFGEPATHGELHAFVVHSVKTCLEWLPHTRETLADLMASSERLGSRFLEQLWEAIVEWEKDADDEDRAWLRERVRVSTRRWAKPAEEGDTEAPSLARRAFDLLEPSSLIWKHSWLFQSAWVQESRDELNEDNDDIDARDRRIRAQRVEAVQDVLANVGREGLLQLAFSGSAAFSVGWSAANAVNDEESVWDLLDAVLEDGKLLGSETHQSLVAGLLQGLGKEQAVAMVKKLWVRFGEDVGVKLLCLCEFDRPAWSATEAMGEMVVREYWAQVQPAWRRHADDELNFAVSRLLEAKRSRAAFDFAHIDWGRVESAHIRRILLDLPGSVERAGHRRLDAYSIQQALRVLGERDAFSRTDLARLEFIYLDLFWRDEDGLPNLEKEIEENPSLFCEAIALAYRHEDDTERREPTQSARRAAEMAHRLLEKLSHIPGHGPDGTLRADVLTDWVLKAQQLCTTSGRKGIGDQKIGQLLANAPTGDDGVWPCVPVRETLESVLNEDIQIGFETGKYNARGVHVRGEGGEQERELAAQYDRWAKACDYAYPKVATTLRNIASGYGSDALWQDQDSAVQRRLGY
ncbi:MAG: helix-turn-helix domain-containing protein [Gammaproteobacteria bacterium]|nr:helix-turn-helix domain-containing protein [Gammaproteobacteria bacterium]